MAQALFGELGIITGWRNGQPIYNDYFLSADPHERLLIAGHWQDGLVPQLGVTPPDQEQFDAKCVSPLLIGYFLTTLFTELRVCFVFLNSNASPLTLSQRV